MILPKHPVCLTPIAIAMLAPLMAPVASAQVVSVAGEFKRWHKATLTLEGPAASETATPNPFADYRMLVTFSNTASGLTYLVPGYFAADGNAADSSASSGNKWRAHLCPDDVGLWTYSISFRTGTNVAIDPNPTNGVALAPYDGASGGFLVMETDKTGRDHRGKGRLEYVNRHHLRFKHSGEYFLKAGPDSPENMLAYDDFDDTPNDPDAIGNLRKSWSPHAGDYVAAQAAGYTWQNGKGSNLLGAVKYLSDKGMNALSFLTFSLDGDDDNVFPHRLTGTVDDYEGIADDQRWASNAVYRDRFDVSKLDQWERVFSYCDKKGIYLHFKTQERENDHKMDGGEVGRERKLYYRELIARYAHHLALNWNCGEENTQTTAQHQAMARYFHDTDPYRHHVVLQTVPFEKDTIYPPLLGNASEYTGASLQSDPGQVFADTSEWVTRSAAAGAPWVVANDEQGPATTGIDCDNADFNHDNVRQHVLWGNLMAGGAGIESYFGSQTCAGDLTCEDYRTRDNWWNLCRHALECFTSNTIPFWDMTNNNSLVTTGHCLSGTATWLIYLPSGGTTTLDLTGAEGTYEVRWYDPRNGGELQAGSIPLVSGGGLVELGTAPGAADADWAVLVRSGGSLGVFAGPDQKLFLPPGADQATVLLDGTVIATEGISYTSLWSQVSGPEQVRFENPAGEDTQVTFGVAGTYVLELSVGTATHFSTDTLSIEALPFSLIRTNPHVPLDDVYIDAGTVVNNNALLVEYPDAKTYIRFGGTDIPTDAVLHSATLRVRAGGDPGEGTVRFWRGSHANWTETTVTASTAPVMQDELSSYSGTITGSQTLSLDVTALLSAEGDHTVIITQDSGGSDVAFASRETGIGPELEVAYELIPPPPPLLNGLSSANGVRLEWMGTQWQLQEASEFIGPYGDVLPGPASPYQVPPVAQRTFYRLRWAP